MFAAMTSEIMIYKEELNPDRFVQRSERREIILCYGLLLVT